MAKPLDPNRFPASAFLSAVQLEGGPTQMGRRLLVTANTIRNWLALGGVPDTLTALRLAVRRMRTASFHALVPVNAQPLERDQRDSPVGAFSGKPGIPNINRNRFPGWSVASCFQESARSLSVKGVASRALIGAGLAESDTGWPSRSVVEVELGCDSFIQVSGALVGLVVRDESLVVVCSRERKVACGNPQK